MVCPGIRVAAPDLFRDGRRGQISESTGALSLPRSVKGTLEFEERVEKPL